MAKIKTNELIGPALDWAVAECEKVRTYVRPYEHTMTGLCILDADLVDMGTDDAQELRYSRDWEQGGQIIDREGISTRLNHKQAQLWEAYIWLPTQHDQSEADSNSCTAFGTTPLIAAMRCYVASKLGATIEVPDELL